MRLVAIHNRALTLQQIQQNFAAGVGEKFFMLFGIEHIVERAAVVHHVRSGAVRQLRLPVHESEVRQPRCRPRGRAAFRCKGMRIGLNGAEPHVGQAYRLLDTDDHGCGLLTGDGRDDLDRRHDHRPRTRTDAG